MRRLPPAAATPGVGSIVRLAPAFDSLVPKDAVIGKVAGGFTAVKNVYRIKVSIMSEKPLYQTY